uniref:Ig-like domain-containing protein n=1 Tax=Pelodiscus sinensis TaxID=13735 RepID=K7GDB8_PELSI
PQAPSVFPLFPCCGDIAASPSCEVTIACLVTGYFPEPVAVKWNSGTGTNGTKTYPAVVRGSGNAFTLVSQLTVCPCDLERHTYQCSVEHAQSNTKIDVVIPNVCEVLVPPEVRLLPPSCERDTMEQHLELVCLLLRFTPGTAKVEWLVNGEKRLPTTDLSFGKGTDKSYTGQSRLNVTKESWKTGDVYTCKVTHPSTGKEYFMQNTSKCLVSSPVAVEVFLLPPSLEDLYIAHTASITCLVSGMETHDTPEFSWTRKSGGPLNEVSRVSELQENGTYSATSVLQVCVEEWQSGEEFTCSVKHQDIPSAIVKTIHKSKEVSLRAPSVYVFPPHAKELALQEWATITCLVSGFQPRNILVLWTRKDKPMPEDAYTNIGPIREAGVEESYFIYSKLRIQASEWQKGDTFSCMVGHEGLPKIFTQQSVDKASSKPTAVNVSVVLSDTEVACH